MLNGLAELVCSEEVIIDIFFHSEVLERIYR